MTLEPKTNKPAPEKELFIHLDLPGLAALLKALEAAMAEDKGHLSLGSAGGIAIRSGSFERFATATLTFGPFDDRDPLADPEPRPVVRTPVLALHG